MFFQIFFEGLRFAWKSITVNKLRTFLSLLGVTIGIVAIISVFTIVDSLEKNIRDSLSSLGDNVVYVGKWPWGSSGEYKWWKFFNRPEPTFQEFKMLRQKMALAESVAFMFEGSRTVKKDNDVLENVSIKGITYDFSKISNFNIEKGRFFNENEIVSGKNHIIIGHNIYETIFNNINPIGKEIKISGVNSEIIGVIEKEGESITGTTQDNSVLAPYLFAKRFLKERGSDPIIMVSAKNGVTNEELKNEIRQMIRTIRRIRPLDEDNFALNETSIITQGLDKLFRIISISGWIIGGFSILVGGFGIANIMFVSVKERTNIIGIQKALGAKNHFILLQFLFEAILLCLFGGLFGLLIVWAISRAADSFIDINLVLTFKNIVLGISISTIIGVLSGFFPAYFASKLNPIDAIRK